MSRNLIIKTLAFGIVALFVGVGIHPAFAVDTKQSFINRASEEDCGCKEIDKRELIVFEKQLNRLEVYSKLLSVLSKHHPEVLEEYDKLIDMISTLNTLDLKDVICDLLKNNFIYFEDKFYYYLELSEHFFDEGRIVLGFIATDVSYIYFGLMMFTGYIALDILGCDWTPELQSYN